MSAPEYGPERDSLCPPGSSYPAATSHGMPSSPQQTAAPTAPPWTGVSPATARVVRDSLQTARIAAETVSGTHAQRDDRLDKLTDQLQEILITLENLRSTLESLTDHAADHEKRLRPLERWQQRMTPVLGLITFLLGAILTSVLKVWLPS